jgi:hypothetical protein
MSTYTTTSKPTPRLHSTETKDKCTATMASEDQEPSTQVRRSDRSRRDSRGLVVSGFERHVMAMYVDMLARCYVPAHPEYVNEGARGIRICDRWLEGFRNYFEDVGLPLEEDDGDGN